MDFGLWDVDIVVEWRCSGTLGVVVSVEGVLEVKLDVARCWGLEIRWVKTGVAGLLSGAGGGDYGVGVPEVART